MKTKYILVLAVLFFANCKSKEAKPAATVAETPVTAAVPEPKAVTAPDVKPDYAVGGFKDVKAFEKFFGQFQLAVAANQKQGVAGMVAFPIKGRVDWF